MLNSDNRDYLRFTGPQRLDRAIHTLEGLIRGIALDRRVNEQEVAAITQWMNEYRIYANYHPFNEVVTTLLEVLQDGQIDEVEKADILWLCAKYTSPNRFYDNLTSDMQRLQGICGGMAADGVVNEQELLGLREWLDSHGHLRTLWPYDEFDALLLAVLKDGVIDADEQRQLIAFFREFIDLPDCQKTVSLPESDESSPLLTGICAACPEIEFQHRAF